MLKELNNLDRKKALGTYRLFFKLLRIVAPSMASGITHVINLSISASKLPTPWKMARVCPIFKSWNCDDMSNFRPISILCVISTISEKHAYNHLYDFLMQYRLIHVAQSGFRCLHSCETVLVKMVYQWSTSMNKGDLTGLVLLDLQKAFDMVDHQLLLHKLKLYNVSGHALKWFSSYFLDRKQALQIH